MKGIQYANKMGFEVVAISNSPDKEGLARKLGAHHFISGDATAAATKLAEMGYVCSFWYDYLPVCAGEQR